MQEDAPHPRRPGVAGDSNDSGLPAGSSEASDPLPCPSAMISVLCWCCGGAQALPMVAAACLPVGRVAGDRCARCSVRANGVLAVGAAMPVFRVCSRERIDVGCAVRLRRLRDFVTSEIFQNFSIFLTDFRLFWRYIWCATRCKQVYCLKRSVEPAVTGCCFLSLGLEMMRWKLSALRNSSVLAAAAMMSRPAWCAAAAAD